MDGRNDDVIHRLEAWGEEQEGVRAMLLTSTRAVPNGKVDALSDYDVILVVRDIRPFADDRRWIGDFGEVLVAYWDPVAAEPAGNVVQYAGDLKLDFTLWPVALLERLVTGAVLPVELDAGYRVLLDKDGMASRLREPTYRGYVPERPDEATHLTLVSDFLVGAPYVAKCLLRDELLPARWCLDYDMRYVYLLPMLEWSAECEQGWAAPVGINGKGLKRLLPPETWAEVEATFAGAGIGETWEAMFRMMALFRRVGREVGEHLGYTYPEELDRRVTAHVRRMRERGLG
jgi:aminoglycoside 6-adenylyltransferase